MLFGAPEFAHAQTADSTQKFVHVAYGYRVTPNITYQTANNWDAKLDIYQPSEVTTPGAARPLRTPPPSTVPPNAAPPISSRRRLTRKRQAQPCAMGCPPDYHQSRRPSSNGAWWFGCSFVVNL